MFGIGLPELIIIAVVALIFIGPKNLPGVLRSLGRGLVQVKRATNEVRETVQEEMDQIEREIDLKDVKETATGLKQEFDSVKSSMDPLQINRMSSEEQLESVAEALDDKKNNQPNLEQKQKVNSKHRASESSDASESRKTS